MQTHARGRSALVVEDHFFIADDLKRALLELGYDRVRQTGSAAEAKQMLDEDQPDLVTVDLTLRDGDGTPLARSLAARGVPFVYVTGYAQQEGLGPAAPWLVKPYAPEDFESAVIAAVIAGQAKG